MRRFFRRLKTPTLAPGSVVTFATPQGPQRFVVVHISWGGGTEVVLLDEQKLRERNTI